MADVDVPLQYGEITGDFWAVLEDSVDEGFVPDSAPLMGTVVFTPSYRTLRVNSTDDVKKGIVYVDTVTAQVVNGVLVDDYGEPGISLLAETSDEGGVTPHDLSWTVTFQLQMFNGERLESQPEPTQIRLQPGESNSISDFLPSKFAGGQNVTVISVDLDTRDYVDTQVNYVDALIESLRIAVQDGVVKGDPGEPGPQGIPGDLGPIGPPGRTGSAEIYNYVKNPVPTSNEGYHAQNGTVEYSSNSLILTPSADDLPASVSWIEVVPTYPSTNMYLNFDASTDSSTPIQSTIIFLDSSLDPVDHNTLVHTPGDDEMGIPSEVVQGSTGSYVHTAYTDEPAAFAIFSVGFSESVSVDTTLTVSKFFFSDTPGFYFNGDDVIDSYLIRWAGTPNDSYSILLPESVLSPGSVLSVNGQGGDVVVDSESLNLENVDNTSDMAKPVSFAAQEALDTKVDSDQFVKEWSSRTHPRLSNMFLSDFDRYGTQEVWSDLGETFVDVSYVSAPMVGSSLVRLTIPGGSAGPSASSIPTVEIPSGQSEWAEWRQLESGGSTALTDISGAYDTYTSTLKVIARRDPSVGPTTIALYSITQDGDVSSVGQFISSSTEPYRSPSIVPTEDSDGSMYMYYLDSSGNARRVKLNPQGSSFSLGASESLAGISRNAPLKVTNAYGGYIAATTDGSVEGSPGIRISHDGVTWFTRGIDDPGRTWDVGADTEKMVAYPGTSKGKVGLYIDYIQSSDHSLRRLFATADPMVVGSDVSVSVPANGTSTVTVRFPGTLVDVPKMFVSSDDARLSLAVIQVTQDTAVIEGYNMRPAESATSNATIAWTAIS